MEEGGLETWMRESYFRKGGPATYIPWCRFLPRAEHLMGPCAHSHISILLASPYVHKCHRIPHSLALSLLPFPISRRGGAYF